MNDTPAIKQNANGIYMLEGEQLWDSDLLPIILEHINPGDTVIDAGAWIGGHAMAYAKKVGNEGKVYAFEPNPFAFTCLYRNTERFPLNVRCDQVALGDQFGSVAFSAKTSWYDSGYVGANEVIATVNLRPLDHYDITPNFIKIDVEGCELKVLKGAAKTIEKFRPVMVVEINEPALKRQGDTPQQVIDWLTGKNYGMSMIEECTGQDIYNILCIPR